MGSFSCSIPHSFVLSHNMPVTNATSNWLRFGAFLSPPVPSLRIQWPLTQINCPSCLDRFHNSQCCPRSPIHNVPLGLRYSPHSLLRREPHHSPRIGFVFDPQ